MAEHAASPGRASSIGSLDDDWDEIGLQQRHWQSVSIEERKSVSPVIPLQQPPPPQPPSAHAEQPKKQLPPSPAQPAPKQEPQPQPLPQPPTSVPSPTQTASLPQTVPQHTLKAVSICSFNAALDADLDRALSQSSGAHSTATPTSPRSPPRPFGSSGLAARAERILDFCRSIHIVLLQEVRCNAYSTCLNLEMKGLGSWS
ncbi:hypothetical protein BCR33DRAFT_528382 [Rhizoclosmatium globosum]|uniref:Uncharacterized protein n=1 Tax=Rhizoclosmatium globosum TaxID=329046 RepID=A0A1Y2CTU5_9FUNG|nr:hypothetical protein BCR33DRAFT_528382 [Rhizoclosmatium globosum]|eukprot:ORY50387.1 hypothetical protein BCR33DRAFT_528382 [Rhizoclosmatium globosum]